MSNVLINKFKTIDDSRVRLKSILEEKGIQPSSTSLPGLVEDVNKLTGEIIEPEWTGVPIEEAPTDYYKPDIDFDAIYEADKDKDNYSLVTLLLIKVSDFPHNIPQGAINGFDKYKFSDTQTLEGYTNNTYKYNLAHTWSASKDINNGKGEKYRWILCYSNIDDIGPDMNSNYLQLEGLIVYKGKYASWGWRDSHCAPVYTELKSDCSFTSTLRVGSSQYQCPAPRTFISNAQSFAPADGLFANCTNLEYYYDSSSYYDSTQYVNHNSVWANCYNLKYIYIKQAYNFYEACFSLIHDCYIQIDEILYNLGRDNNYASVFARSHNNRIHIGTIHGDILYLSNERDDLQQTYGNEIEIDEVQGNIRESAFNCNSNWGLWKHVKVNRIAGTIGNYAFQCCPLYGTVKLIESTKEPTLGAYAFNGSTVSKIDMSESSILTIGNYAFGRCDNLTEISIGPKTHTINEYVFEFSPNLKSIYIPDNVTTIASTTFWRSYLETITLGEGITSLPTQCFSKLFNLRQVNLPEALTVINAYAFRNCKSLTEIIIPAKIDTIPTYCFAYSGLKKITFKNTSVKLNAYAFEGCSDLRDINLENVSTYLEYVFNGCRIPEIILDDHIISYTTNSFNNSGAKIVFKPTFRATINMNINCCDINKSNILDLLYGLPTLTTGYTLDMCPTIANSTWDAGYTFWDEIKTKYIIDTGTSLEWATSSTAGAITVANYTASKKWTIT